MLIQSLLYEASECKYINESNHDPYGSTLSKNYIIAIPAKRSDEIPNGHLEEKVEQQ